MNFTGDGASAYSSSLRLPITIPAGLILPIALKFTPGGSAERFEAAMELASNDIVHPTYSVWAKPTAGSGEDVLFNRDGAFSNNDSIYGCSVTAGGAVRFRISGTEVLVSDDGVVPDDSAHHIVVTHLDSPGFGDFTADRTRLYLDGVMIAENTDTLEVPEYFDENSSRLWIGTRSAAGAGFNGDLDEFQMDNIELNEEQVQRLFSEPTTIIENTPPVPLVITDMTRAENGSAVAFTFRRCHSASTSMLRSP